jgi:hypothetical protein
VNDFALCDKLPINVHEFALAARHVLPVTKISDNKSISIEN